MRYIGDVHCKFNDYVEITKSCNASIQVGDFGLGFGIEAPVLAPSHRFIRGNHDNPQLCREHSNWIADNSFDATTGTYFLGGGFSVDLALRTVGKDFWPDEELSYSELSAAIEHYEQCKPAIVVSHEAPASIASKLFSGLSQPSNTAHALDAMLYAWHPKTWLFGHHHTTVQDVIEGTKFYCLAELDYVDL
jgi:hypothetical protein